MSCKPSKALLNISKVAVVSSGRFCSKEPLDIHPSVNLAELSYGKGKHAGYCPPFALDVSLQSCFTHLAACITVLSCMLLKAPILTALRSPLKTQPYHTLACTEDDSAPL